MADICPVCNEKIGFLDERRLATDKQENLISLHLDCLDEFKRNQEKYEGIERQERIEEKSVHVKSIDMPFGEMVVFIFKWTMASLPTALFLAILFLLFTAS